MCPKPRANTALAPLTQTRNSLQPWQKRPTLQQKRPSKRDPLYSKRDPLYSKRDPQTRNSVQPQCWLRRLRSVSVATITLRREGPDWHHPPCQHGNTTQRGACNPVYLTHVPRLGAGAFPQQTSTPSVCQAQCMGAFANCLANARESHLIANGTHSTAKETRSCQRLQTVNPLARFTRPTPFCSCSRASSSSRHPRQ